MNAKTLKKVFAAVLAIAILAVGIPVSMPTVVKADPAVPTFATTANAKDLTSQFYFIDATYQAAYAENGSVTIPSGVGVLDTSGIVNSENAITYAQVKLTFPNASSTVTGDTEIGIAFGYKGWDRTNGGTSPIASSTKGNVFYVATRCAHNNQYYITANGEAVGNSKTCYTNSAYTEYTITYKYDSNTKILESWFAYPDGVAYNSLDTSTISGFFFDVCAIAADGANCDVTFSDFKFWRTYPETAVNYADYTDVVHSEASSVGTAPYNSDSYIAGHSSSIVDYYTFNGLDYDLTDGKEIIMTGDITLPTNCSTTTNWGQVGFVMGSANSKPLVSSMVVINNNNKFYNFVHNAYPCDQGILHGAYGDVRIAPRTFNFKVVLTSTSINTYINDSLYNNWNGGQAVALDEAMQAALTTTDLGIYFRNMAPGAEVNNVRIYGSGVAIGDKTYTQFDFKKTGRANSETFTTLEDKYINNEVISQQGTPKGAITYEVTNMDFDFEDEFTVSVSYKGLDRSINDSYCFLGLLLGKYNDTYITMTHFSNWGKDTPLHLWDDNEKGKELVSKEAMYAAGTELWNVLTINYKYTYKDGVYTFYYSVHDNEPVQVGTITVEEICEEYGIETFEPLVGLRAVVRNDTTENRRMAAASFNVTAPADIDFTPAPVIPEEPVKEPIAVGDEFTFDGGKVVVTGVDTDNALLTVKVVADAGYQLVAGSLKNNDANIINAIDEAGTEFTVKLAEEDNVITAAFTAAATQNVSAAVLGTGVRRDENDNIDGIRFVNRLYLPTVDDETFINVQWDDIYVNYNGVEYLVKDYGMIAGRNVEGELTMDNAKWTVTAKRGKIFALTNNYIDMTVVIMSDAADFADRVYTVRGYLVLEAADGSTETILTEAFTDSVTAAVGRGA